MEAFWKRLEGLGVPIAGSTLRGETNLARTRAIPHHWSGKSVVVYDAKVILLEVVRDGAVVCRLDPGSEMFDTVVAQLDLMGLVPGSELLVEAGDQPPVRDDVFGLDLAKVAVLDKADDDFFQAVLDGAGTERFDEIAWTKFRVGAAFGRNPCSREDFLSLREEYLASRYCGSGLEEYFDWHARSAKMLDAEGKLNEQARERADYLLDAWSGLDPKLARYNLLRGMEVHPRHCPEFTAYADGFRLRVGQEAPAAPVLG